MRRLLPPVLAAGLLLAGCSDDGSATSPATSAPTTTTEAPTSTTAIPFDDTFAADDVEQLCADLAGLTDIDPLADPTQADVDRLRAIGTRAPDGVAQPLAAVARYGQAIVDGGNGRRVRGDALEGAVILIAYGNEVCGINVPLFNTIAGV